MGIAELNWLRRCSLDQINPLLKIGLCLLMINFALLLRDLWAIGVLAGTLLGLLLVTTRISIRMLGYGAIAFIVFVAISAGLREIQVAWLGALRLMAILIPAPLLANTTPPADLVRALQVARLPNFLTLSLMLIWRFLPMIQQEARRILEANQLRGVDLSRRLDQWFPGLFVPLIFRIVAYADEVTIGLETRGYDPDAPRSLSRPLTWKAQDTHFTLGCAFLLAVVACLEWLV